MHRKTLRRRLVPAFLCALLASFPLTAQDSNPPRGMCELGVEPAATLLLPYFEVDLSSNNGTTTLLSINNAWDTAALTNVTLWTDYGMPTLNFSLYLTGYDVATINVRDFFLGNIPITADDGTDPTDTISPHGNHPEWDASFDQCENFFPFFVNPVINDALLERITAYHTGAPSTTSGTCGGSDQGDGRVRGYITIDRVRECTVDYPSDPVAGPGELPYFVDGGLGVATNDNQLWGDFYLVDPAEDYAVGEPLVHVQAFDSAAWQDGDPTFYGRFVEGSARDNREPLPSAFGVRYLSGGAFSGGTELLVWREAEASTDVTCGTLPPDLPLGQREVYAFNEEEDVEELCFDPGCPVCSAILPPVFFNCLPLATQRIDIADDANFEEPGYAAGWLYLDLNPVEQFPDEPEPRQAWVISQVSASGRFSVGLPAVALHSVCDGLPVTRDLGIFD